MDKTREMIGSTLFRKKKFRYKFEELMEMLSSMDLSYRNLLLDEEGKILPQKRDKMIADLVQCLIQVRAYRKISESFTGGEMRYEELNKKQTKFYQDFFYLILGLSMYTGNCQWSEGSSHTGGTFNAIFDIPISLTKGISKEELDRDIINAAKETAFVADARLRIPAGIFARLTVAFQYLTGKDLTNILTKQEFQKGYDLLTDIEKKLCDNPNYKNKLFDKEQKELDEALSMLDPRELWGNSATDEYSPKELNEMEEESYMIWGNMDKDENIVLWKEYFDDASTFKDACKNVHSGFFDSEIKKITEDELADLIEVYLSKKGLSSWLDDEKFFTIYTYLTKICNKVYGRH